MKSVKSVPKKLGISSVFKLAQRRIPPLIPPLIRGVRKEQHKGFMESNQADFI